MTTLHLMTQRDQPYGSERRCCEMCGLMMVSRPDSFWRSHAWTDEPDHYKHWPAGSANVPDELVPCVPQPVTPNAGVTGASEIERLRKICMSAKEALYSGTKDNLEVADMLEAAFLTPNA